MSLQVIHAPEPTPATLTKSVFLAGPSPRGDDDPNWRPAAIAALRSAGFDGTVFAPIPRDGQWPENYLDQVEWEQQHIKLADVAAFWCPRDLQRLPGFTTNVEFGELLQSGKMLYGRPDGAPKTRYLDARYRQVNAKQKKPFDEPAATLDQLAQQIVARIGDGAARTSGERFVPLNVWRSKQFQAWYGELITAGNRLDGADVQWTFHIPQANNVLLCYAMRVKVWVTAEQRHKENEFVVSRPDISTICAFARSEQTHEMLDTKILLIKEFRAPARTGDGFVHELPGGSSFTAKPDAALQVAAEELHSETGLKLEANRFREMAVRQMAATFGTHKAHVFAVELTAQEMAQAERTAKAGTSFGDESETEKTYLEVKSVREILNQTLLDHATVGMILETCLERWVERE